MRKNYEVLLFDLDDTLINDTENIRYALKKMLEFFKEEYTEEKLMHWLKLDSEHWILNSEQKIIVPQEFQETNEMYTKYLRSLRYYKYFKGKISLEDALNYNEIFINHLKEIVIPFPNTSETLKYLYQKYLLVIATDGPKDAAKEKLRKINALNFFKYIFSADMTSYRSPKPRHEFFINLEEYINYSQKEKMIIIGDRLDKDIKLGMNVKIDSIWVNRTGLKCPNNYTPTYEIKDLLELKRIL